MSFFALFQVICLGFFLCVVVAQTIRLRVRRRTNAITLSVERKGLQGLMEILLLVGVTAWIAAVLLYVLPLEPRPLPWLYGAPLFNGLAAKIAGVAVVIAAFAIQVSALIALGDSWRLGIDVRSSGPLVTHGIYALSRNPIYIFFDLYFVGTFLINGASVFLVFAVLVVANLHYQTLKEEEFLGRLHGLAYERYRRRVGRYVRLRRAETLQPEWARHPASE
jgi:protein-S-isoprenylcysteine O-methyltransferase Ste14